MKKTEILYGIHPLYEALNAGRRSFHELYITKDKPSMRITEVVRLAHSRQIPVKQITPAQLEKISGSDQHQGISAKVDPYPLTDISGLLKKAESDNSESFFLLLDNISDPHNLGALIRTALCAGVHGIIIPKDRAAQPTPSVARASAGALEHVPLARVTNIVNIVKTLQKKGIWIAGLDRSAGQSVYDAELTCPVGIIIGNEEKGIRPNVKKHCDFLISIPQKGPVDSLNASVSGAVAMYEVYRQRATKQNPKG